MSAGILPLGKSLRIAYITKVRANYVECEFYDKFGEKPFSCPIPHPYAGRGGGVLIGAERNTLVLVANGPQEQWFIVGIIPNPAFHLDMAGVRDIRVGESSYPDLQEGEVSLKGNPGQHIDLLNNGNISMDAGIGTKSYDLELSKATQGLFMRVNNLYQFTEAGRTIEGIVKRDKNAGEDPNETGTTDFLTGESYERMLTSIGRSPADEVQARSTTNIKPVTRNPAFVEKRSITYEFGDSFGVRSFGKELEALKTVQGKGTAEEQAKEIELSIERLRTDPSTRENRRTDVLDLNPHNYNHLIESVQGTLVDVYGNVLDLNRHPIAIPEVEELADTQGDSSKSLEQLYTSLRRSVKYHLEINSRKPGTADLLDVPANGLGSSVSEHSRFSVDIDAEGLTKINIPASSETGNIPILTRHVVRRDPDHPDGVIADKDLTGYIDVQAVQFGAKKVQASTVPDAFAGAQIKDSTYTPESTNNLPITVGSAFHDLFNIANSIFTKGKLSSPTLDFKADTPSPPLNLSVDNTIPDTTPGVKPTANAGGRSLHMNLDGSLEASIGADTVDRKSLVLDTAGGVLAHLGRDRNGRSIITQTDGDIIIQVGGLGVYDKRFNQSMAVDESGNNVVVDGAGNVVLGSNGKPLTGLDVVDENGNLLFDKNSGAFLMTPNTVQSVEDRPGRVEIHFNRGDGELPSKIVIDEFGITIRSEGRMLLSSGSDMSISSDSNLLIHGESVKVYGAVDLETREILGAERLCSRKGRAF
jgi:hypothetical protein